MKRILSAIVFVCLCAVQSFAGTIPITGTIRLANGNLLNGRVRFTLNVSVAQDTCSSNVVVSRTVEFAISNGSLPMGARIVPNDCLSPSMTTYTAQYLTTTGQVFAQNIYYVSGSQFNIGTATPTPLTTSNISFGSFTGLDNVSSKKVNNVRKCDVFPGSNAGAKIANCIADLPSTGGIADARGFEGAQTISSDLNITKSGVTLKFGGSATYTVTHSQTINASNVTVDMGNARFTVNGMNTDFFSLTGSNIHMLGGVINGNYFDSGGAGFETQGRFTLVGCSYCVVDGTTWNNTGMASYFSTASDGVQYKNLTVIDTAAGIQGIASTDVLIQDSYFRGRSSTTLTSGSDDQIAVFSGNGAVGRRVVISGNVIDKQGATSKNNAHCIFVSPTSSASLPLSEVIIEGNVCSNSASTTNGFARAGIALVQNNSSSALSTFLIANNIINNANAGIIAAVGTGTRGKIIGNQIDTIITVGGTYFGQGIRVAANGVGTPAEIDIQDNIIQSTVGIGLEASTLTRSTISGNSIIGATSKGIEVDTCTGCVINSNRAYNTASGPGFALNALTGGVLVGNVGLSSGTYGFAFTGAWTDVVVANNKAYNNVSGTTTNSSTPTNVTVIETDGVNNNFLNAAAFQSTLSAQAGKWNVNSNGATWQHSNLDNTSARPSIATTPIANEHRGECTNLADDCGFTRLSSGGGTTANQQTYVDLTAGSTMGRQVIIGTLGTDRATIDANGITVFTVAFSNLPGANNGAIIYCSDCQIASPCASGGSGALAKRINGTWICNWIAPLLLPRWRRRKRSKPHNGRVKVSSNSFRIRT